MGFRIKDKIVEIIGGRDDTHYGLAIGRPDDPYYRLHLTPQGDILQGPGNSPPLPIGGGSASHPDLDAHDVLGLAKQSELDVEKNRIGRLEKEGPVVNIKDFGAIGDGVVRKVTATQLADKTALGFSGAHRLDDFDADDTQDWLAIVRTIKHLQARGGGTVYVPKPSVTYPIFRFIPTPVGVPIRIMGDGCDPDIFDIDNVCNLLTGWNETERRAVFQPATFALQALVVGGVGASTQVAVAAVSVGYSPVVPLAAGGGATFAAGDRVVVYHTDNFPTGATVCPFRLTFRRVVEVSGDELVLDDVVPFVLPSGKGRVAKMGTGSNGSLGGAPYDFVEDLEISGLNVRGTGLFGFASAGRNVLAEDFGVRADRAVSASVAIGLSLNGYVDSTFRRGHILTNNRGIEIKAGSGGRQVHTPEAERGGTGLLIQDVESRQIGAAAANPLISVGESSNAKLERVTVVTNSSSFATLIKVDDSELTVIRGAELHADGADSSKQAIQLVGHKSPVDRSILDVKGLRLGGRPLKWSRAYVCTDPADGRPSPVLIDSGLRAGSTFGAGAAGAAYAVPFVVHGSIADFASEVGETLGFTASSVAQSPISGVLGATAAQIADVASWVNTSYKKWGRPVYDTTNRRLLYAPDRTAASAWTRLAIKAELDSHAALIHMGVRRKVGWWTSAGIVPSPVTNTVGVLAVQPFVVAEDIPVDQFGLWVTTAAGVGGTFEGAVYQDNGTFYPGTLLLSGSIDTTVGGARSVAVSGTIPRGIVWVGGLPLVAAAGLTNGFGNIHLPTFPSQPATQYTGHIQVGSGLTALPSSFPAGATITNGTPRLSFRMA